MSVSNIEIDIYKFLFDHSGHNYMPTNYQFYTEFIDKHSYYAIVRRLDQELGWGEDIKALQVYNNTTRVINIGPSELPEKKVLVEVDFDLLKGEPAKILPRYQLIDLSSPKKLNRDEFNKMFNTDLVVLPRYLYACGVKNNEYYIYNEFYADYFEIVKNIKFMASIGMTFNILKEFYFIICAEDGYMMDNWHSLRNKPKFIGQLEYDRVQRIIIPSLDEYPVMHSDRYIMGQAIHKDFPFALDVVDRHFLYCNLYHVFRSFHSGVPFKDKINRIIHACRRSNGSKHNFTKRRDIELSPRLYFDTDDVCKDNIDCPKWIDTNDMVNYKYILDVDGNSNTWDATAWKLNSGSIIMKSDTVWRQFFYDEYLPWVHFIPIADDFSDIQEKYKWCEENQEECLKIIDNCKKLFQKIFTVHNVIDDSINKLYISNRLKPTIVNNQRIFICSSSDSDNLHDKLIISKQSRFGLKALTNIVRKVYPTDLILYFNNNLIDIHNLDLEEVINRFKSLNKKIIFGAEKNLWPYTLNPLLKVLNNLAPSNTDFKYLQGEFIIGEASEFDKIFNDNTFGDSISITEYFTYRYITNKYSIGIDYHQKLVLCAYQCDKNTIQKAIDNGTQFILYNGGR